MSINKNPISGSREGEAPSGPYLSAGGDRGNEVGEALTTPSAGYLSPPG